ncbi:MAG TPA: EamA family transporter RarD, partial [Candidatus Competibacteraceae bacterium]|nr:EamA family transporter RarD [Candidatus Competibacteraceae bacterium]
MTPLSTSTPARPTLDSAAIGLLNALGCFTLWGSFPIYFKLLQHVPALEVLAYRVLGSAVLLLALILAWGQWPTLRSAF